MCKSLPLNVALSTRRTPRNLIPCKKHTRVYGLRIVTDFVYHKTKCNPADKYQT